MSFLKTADKWVCEYASHAGSAVSAGALLKGMSSPALWKLCGCFIVPAGFVSLALEAASGERASNLFQLFSGLLLAGLFMWRYLVHRRAYASKLEGGAHNA